MISSKRRLIASLLFFQSVLSVHSAPNLLGIPLVDIYGRQGALGAWEGQVILVVNVASECGYTRQYAGLEALYQKYKDKGFVVLGFPSNDYGAQEPGTNADIQKFCSSTYNVTFPLFSKVSLRTKAHPLFTALTSPESPIPGPITWNFNKFLIGSDGVLKARFSSDTEPDSLELKNAVDKELEAKTKRR
ncbi:MAG: glutathione peroxidase [Verrucomicrobia bacterium]|nr:MAG: glutathione peroxidase [Verrucomicrobiota bacterium]